MFHLVWKDINGHYDEEHDSTIELAKRLLELASKEADNNYNTQVISLIQGERVDYEYQRDDINLMETLMIRGKRMISHKLPNLHEKLDAYCPICGCDGWYIDNVEIKIDGEYTSLISYGCSECDVEFYIR